MVNWYVPEKKYFRLHWGDKKGVFSAGFEMASEMLEGRLEF